jgi:hypothetical protein
MKMILIYVGVALGTILLTAVFLFLFCPEVFFNGLIKRKIESSFMKSNPGMKIKISSLHYHFWSDKIDVDTITITNNQSVLLYQIINSTVSGIKFCHLLKGGPTENEIFGYVAETKELFSHDPDSKYEVRLKSIHLCAADSSIVAEGLEYHLRHNDKEFFEASKLRQTRYKFRAPSIKFSGVDYAGLMKGKNLHIHSLKLSDVSLDILINKDVPFHVDSAINPMPNELYNKMKNPFQIDNITIDNGHLIYNESYDEGRKIATLTFNNINIQENEIIDTEKKSVTLFINANGIFNDVTPVNLSMTIPLSSKEFSLKYSGTFGNMNLTGLNHYLDNAEDVRIKSGMVQSATYDVDITSGYASGKIRPIYSDLKVEPGYAKTSQSMPRRKVDFFLANLLLIHKNNALDKKGNIKPGEIKFMRAHDTAFMEMIWLSLWSGVKNIAGF